MAAYFVTKNDISHFSKWKMFEMFLMKRWQRERDDGLPPHLHLLMSSKQHHTQY